MCGVAHGGARGPRLKQNLSCSNVFGVVGRPWPREAAFDHARPVTERTEFGVAVPASPNHSSTDRRATAIPRLNAVGLRSLRSWYRRHGVRLMVVRPVRPCRRTAPTSGSRRTPGRSQLQRERVRGLAWRRPAPRSAWHSSLSVGARQIGASTHLRPPRAHRPSVLSMNVGDTRR